MPETRKPDHISQADWDDSEIPPLTDKELAEFRPAIEVLGIDALIAVGALPRGRSYPVHFAREPDGGFTVTFPDVPEAITYGADKAEARAMGLDALMTALVGCVEGGLPLPAASPAAGRPVIALPALAAAKLALYEAQRTAGLSLGGLAERLGVTEDAARHLLDLYEPSAVRQVVEATGVLVGRAQGRL